MLGLMLVLVLVYGWVRLGISPGEHSSLLFSDYIFAFWLFLVSLFCSPALLVCSPTFLVCSPTLLFCSPSLLLCSPTLLLSCSATLLLSCFLLLLQFLHFWLFSKSLFIFLSFLS